MVFRNCITSDTTCSIAAAAVDEEDDDDQLPPPHPWWWHPEKTWMDNLITILVGAMFPHMRQLADESTTEVSQTLREARRVMSSGKSLVMGDVQQAKAWQAHAGCPIVELIYQVPRRSPDSVCDEYGFRSGDIMEVIGDKSCKKIPSTPIPLHFWFPQSLLPMHANSSSNVTTCTTNRGLERITADASTEKLIRALMDKANKERIPVLLMVHGGGFTVGDPYNGMFGLAASLACNDDNIPLIVASIDYSLAPEHPFPAAPLEVLTVLSHVLTDLACQTVHIAGASAGGNLAASATLEACRTYPGRVRSALIMSPFLDPAAASLSYYENQEDLFAPPGFLRWCWRCYLQLRPPPEDNMNNNDNKVDSTNTTTNARKKDQRITQGSNMTTWQSSKWRGSPWERLVNPTVNIPYLKMMVEKHPNDCPTCIVTTNKGDPLRDEGCVFAVKLKVKAPDGKVIHLAHPGSHVMGSDVDKKAKEELIQTWAMAVFGRLS